MNINFRVTGKERKALVEALSEITFSEAAYAGAPTFAYRVGDYTVDKNGVIFYPPTLAQEAVALVVEKLKERGFTPEGEAQADLPEEDVPAEIPAETPDVAPEAAALAHAVDPPAVVRPLKSRKEQIVVVYAQKDVRLGERGKDLAYELLGQTARNDELFEVRAPIRGAVYYRFDGLLAGAVQKGAGIYNNYLGLVYVAAYLAPRIADEGEKFFAVHPILIAPERDDAVFFCGEISHLLHRKCA